MCIRDSSISSRILPNFYFNKHMMENVGWTTGAPKTTDELYDLLVLIRDNDANEMCIRDRCNRRFLRRLLVSRDPAKASDRIKIKTSLSSNSLLSMYF